MKRVVYFYNLGTRVFDHSEVLMDDKAPVPTTGTNAAGEALGVTTIKPADGLYSPITIDLAKGAWFGVTREEYLASLPKPEPVTPTAEQENQAAMLLQLAQIKTDQAAFNSQIMLQVASLKNGAMKLADGSTTTAPTTATTVTTPTE